MSQKLQVRQLKYKKLQLQKKKLYLQYRNLYWAKYFHVNTKGKTMRFAPPRDFLVDIYKDAHTAQSLRVRKSVQCGVSECFVVSHLEQAERGLAIMYILPKGDIRNRFVNNRINRTLIRVPKYREIVSKSILKVDSVMLKQFGEGVINYIASNSYANFTEFPADAIYYDEKDRMDQEIILLAKDRTSDSEYKYERIVGNPTIDGFGVSKDYDDSSKGKRYFQCDHCNHWQPFDFFQNVVIEKGNRTYEVIDKNYNRNEISNNDVYVYCTKCGKSIDRFAVKQEWVHEFFNHPNRGYHISKIFSPQGSIRDLVDRLIDVKDSDLEFQKFINSDLGLPMVASGSQITESMVRECTADYLLSQNQQKKGIRFAGIDVGAWLHVIIREWVNGKKKLIYKGKLKTEEDVLKLFVMFGITALVMDAMPETRMVENLKKKSNLIYNCFYKRSTRETKINKKNRMIDVQRTVAMDRVMENYTNCMYINPKNIIEDKEYITHMKSNVRVADVSSGEFVWIQKAADHYFHAEGYCDLAGEVAIGRDIWRAYNADYQQQANDNEAKSAFHNIVAPKGDNESVDELIARKSGYTPNNFFNELANRQGFEDLQRTFNDTYSDEL